MIEFGIGSRSDRVKSGIQFLVNTQPPTSHITHATSIERQNSKS